jgi:hypothetical protein
MNYTLSPSTACKGEWSLAIRLLDDQGFETPGALLARALRGRYARELRVFHFTPGRARKWEVLNKAGFTARPADCKGGWRFMHPNAPRAGLPLNNAMYLARAILAARPSPAPAPLTLEVA